MTALNKPDQEKEDLKKKTEDATKAGNKRISDALAAKQEAADAAEEACKQAEKEFKDEMGKLKTTDCRKYS